MVARLCVLTVPDVKNAIVSAGHHDRGVRGDTDGIHIVTGPIKAPEVISIVGAMHLDLLVAAAGESLLAVTDKADCADLLGEAADGSLDLAAVEIQILITLSAPQLARILPSDCQLTPST